MTHYRKSYEVIGYTTENGTCLCIECTEKLFDSCFIEDKLSPIFLDSEWDYQPTCDHCLTKVIDCSVLNPDFDLNSDN